jgi:hypothetical protein
MTDTRIVTTHYRYKPPQRKQKAVPLAGPAVVTPKRKPAVAKKPEPASAVVRKAKPCNATAPSPSPNSFPAPHCGGGARRAAGGLPVMVPAHRMRPLRQGADG